MFRQLVENLQNKIYKNTRKSKKIDLSKEKYENVNLLGFKNSILDFFSIFKINKVDVKPTIIAFLLSLFYLYFFDIVNTLSAYFVSTSGERTTANMIFSVFTAIIYTIFIVFPYFIVTYINKKELIKNFRQTVFNARLYFIYFMFIFAAVFILSRFESFITTYTTQDIMLKAIQEFTEAQSTQAIPTAEKFPAMYQMQDDLSKITMPALIYLGIEVFLYSLLVGMLCYFAGFLVAMKKENKLWDSLKNSFMSFFISPKYVIGVVIINLAISTLALTILKHADLIVIQAIFLFIFLSFQARVVKSLFK